MGNSDKSLTALGFLLALMLSGIFVASSIAGYADREPNDDFNDAKWIVPGTYNGTIDTNEDFEDYYMFNITAGDHIDVSLESTTSSLMMYLYDEDETEMASVEGSSSTTEHLHYQTKYETDYSVCYLIFEEYDEAVDYNFTLTLTPQDDGGSGGDAPETYSDGITVSEGDIAGEVGSGTGEDNDGGEDGMDCYRFMAGMGDRISLTFTTAATDPLFLNLREPDGDYIFQDLESEQGDPVSYEYWTANETAMGWYYLEVYEDGTPGEYTISLDIARQNDAGTGEDAKADHSYASLVAEGDIHGHLEDEDVADSYRLQAGNGDVITVGFKGSSSGDYLYVDLLGSDGLSIRSNRSKETDSGVQFTYYTANETAMQNFYLKVWMDTAPGEYVITLGIEKENDAGAGIDVPGTSATTMVLGAGSYEGWIFDLDTADMYLVRIEGGDILDVTLGISAGASASLVLMNTTMYTIVTRIASSSSPAGVRYSLDSMVDNTTAYLKVQTGSVRYSLGIAITKQDDADSQDDAGGIAAAGQVSSDPVPIGTGSFDGYFHPDDIYDAYSIEVPPGKRLNITVDPEPALKVGGSLYSSAPALLKSQTGSGPGADINIEEDIIDGDTLQLVVGSYGTSGNYSIIVGITDIPVEEDTPTAPTLIAVPGAGKVTLTWTVPLSDGGSAITGYNIYRKTSGSLLAPTLLTTVGGSVLTYVDSLVLSGTTYEYFVRAVNANGLGAASNTVTASPQPPSADSDEDGMPDEWEDENGLDKEVNDANDDEDDDGFTNLEEYIYGTDPLDEDDTPEKMDSDNDGIPDYWEIENELDPTDDSDAELDYDNDTYTNLEEYEADTDPRDAGSKPGKDEDDGGFIGSLPGGIFCCLGLILMGLIVLVIIIIVIVALAKGGKKGKKKERFDEE